MSETIIKRSAPRVCELPGCENKKHFLLCKEHMDLLPAAVLEELFAAWDAQKEPTKRWMRARYKALDAASVPQVRGGSNP